MLLRWSGFSEASLDGENRKFLTWGKSAGRGIEPQVIAWQEIEP